MGLSNQGGVLLSAAVTARPVPANVHVSGQYTRRKKSQKNKAPQLSAVKTALVRHSIRQLQSLTHVR